MTRAVFISSEGARVAAERMRFLKRDAGWAARYERGELVGYTVRYLDAHGWWTVTEADVARFGLA